MAKYEPTKWEDEIVDANGNLVQRGTPLSAKNLNKLETGMVQVDKKVDEFTTQLADTVSNPLTLKTNHNMRRYRPSRGCVVITDDGGRNEFLTILKPVLDQYGFKASIAMELNVVGNKGHMGWDELKILFREGHEIMSHSLTHADLGANDTEELVYRELVESKRIWKEHGMEPKNFVYPYNAAGYHAKANVLKYYRSACGIGTTLVKPPLFQEYIGRIGVGSYQTETLDRLKSMALQAKNEGSVMIIMSHVGFFGGNTGLTSVEQSYEDLISLIHYCAESGIDILTMDESLDRIGNIYQIGIGSESYEIRAADNKIYTNIPSSTGKDMIHIDVSSNTMLPSFFKNLATDNTPKIIYTKIGSGSINNPNIPLAETGLLKTEVVPASGQGFCKQEYRVLGNNIFYYRYELTNSDGWTQWFINGGNLSFPATELSTNQKPSYYNRFIDKVSRTTGNAVEIYYRFGIDSVSNPNLPLAQPGVLKVTKVSTSGILDKQEYRISGSGLTYERYGKDGDVWSNWVSVSPIGGISSLRPLVDRIGYIYFDTTLGKPIWWNGSSWVDATGTIV